MTMRADIYGPVTLPVMPDPEAELDRLAEIYDASRSSGIMLLSRLGLGAETLLDRVPQSVQDRIGRASEAALWTAARAARRSHHVPPGPRWLETGLTTGLGALGGAGGMAGTLAEIPATTTLLLRRIQQIGAAHGFDPRAENVAFDSLRVFADSGPLADDDATDTGFVALRMAAGCEALLRLIQAIAPRLAAVMTKKAAVQAVPALGAAAGAGLNLLYARHYEATAEVHFGLRRLSVEAQIPREELEAALIARLTHGSAP